jgi:hypothetical protein
MAFREAKVYSDGSHYIAIPQKEKQPQKKKNVIYSIEQEERKEEFEKAYKENNEKKQKEKTKTIINEMKEKFESKEKAAEYVKAQMERKMRNLIVRRMRLARKINLGQWNYFCTFTYDDKKHTEDSFRKKLSNAFKKLVSRRNWVIIGVWERSPANNRLHFHGVFYLPEIVGELVDKRDYSTKTHQMQITRQNTYFTERFGRNDFSPLDKKALRYAITYLMKYIEKTEEKIVYSKGLYQYFMSDIMDEDVVCRIGQEEKKLLLFDDFNCWDEGVLMGRVCPEVIAQMRKCNA